MQFEMILTTVGANRHYVDMTGYDTASFQFEMLMGATFNSGVISIKKANNQNAVPVDFSPAKTVSAVGLVELNARDWEKATYLVFETTTASAAAGRVLVTCALKKNDGSIVDPIEVADNGLLIASGSVPGLTSVNKYGRSTDVDTTTYRDIWDVTTQDIWVAPTAARVHQITSTSASDTSGGAGARTIQVYGLTDWDTAETSEVITMNGTSNVATASYVIIHRMKVLTKGATDVNVGTITATADTDSTISAQIEPSAGQTQMAIYGVPSVQTAYMVAYYFSVNKAGGAAALADVQLIINPEPQTELLNFLVKHTQSLQAGGSSYIRHTFNPYFTISGPAIIKCQAVSSVNNADISAGFDLILQIN